MKKYYTAKSDLIFQQALCLEKDKDVLSWFVGKLFNQQVTDLIIKTPVLPIKKKVEKQKTVDLLVTFDDKTVNLEVNSCHYKHLNERNFSYITAVYNEQIQKGKPIYSKRNEVIQINFTWGLPTEYKNIDYLTYEMYDKEHDDKYIDNLKIIIYNMDYYKEMFYNKDTKEFKKDAPKHLLMLDFGGKELEKLCKGEKMMEKFKENVERLNDDKIVIDFLTKEQEDELIKQSYFEDGIDAGIKQGKQEEKIDLAKKMIENNIDIETVSQITGLSIDVLENLK